LKSLLRTFEFLLQAVNLAFHLLEFTPVRLGRPYPACFFLVGPGRWLLGCKPRLVGARLARLRGLLLPPCR
jgi:hypothetical protein